MPGVQTLKAAILTYHSQNIAGSDTVNNDHHALAADLDNLHNAGFRFVSLETLVNRIFSGVSEDHGQPLIALTFDDGCDYDVRTLEFPPHGLQTGFLQIMEDFLEDHGSKAQPGLHATCFVIASPQARQLIDNNSLFGRGHMSDDWWCEADRHRLLAIGNHGWDHNHPDLQEENYTRGGFVVVNTLERCNSQVVRAGEFIEQKTGRYPLFFAYPFGEYSEYMRYEYFPSHHAQHRCLAALGTEAGFVTAESDRWNLPRFVCGRDWTTPRELLIALDL
jgi:peptidoglycan/xylan/chitin deacetylase (PgdA/CDA1 family)